MNNKKYNIRWMSSQIHKDMHHNLEELNDAWEGFLDYQEPKMPETILDVMKKCVKYAQNR